MTRGNSNDRRDARVRGAKKAARISSATLTGGAAAFGAVAGIGVVVANAPAAAAQTLKSVGVPASGVLTDDTPTLPTQTSTGLQCAAAPVVPSVNGSPVADFGVGKCLSFPALDPSTIPADGKATSGATVDVLVCPLDAPALEAFPDRYCDTLTDFVTANELPVVPLETFNLTSSDNQETVQHTGGTGHWTGTIGPSTTIEDATVTASDLITFSFVRDAPTTTAPKWASGAAIQKDDPSLPEFSLTATQTLKQVAGPATAIALTVSPGSIPADGKSTSTVTAIVTDVAGHRLDGQNVAFSSSDPSETISSVTAEGDGVYDAIVTASKAAETATLTATDSTPSTAISAMGKLTQTALPVVKTSPPKVTAPKVTSPPTTLAFTGANSTTLAGLGAMLCAGGAGLVLAARRRLPLRHRVRK